VLTVVKVSVAQGGVYARYLEGRAARSAAGDYYLRDGERVEAPGRWVLGRLGAGAIGVEDPAAPVDPDVFRSLMAVVNPATGERLRRVGGNGSAVGAIDCTFSAPKSVSAVWALAGPELREGIEAAHERAVDAAVSHAVAFVPMVRRRVDRETVVREHPAEVVATSWRHTTARAVADRPPDPQLHSHVLVHAS
jgi:conjugative relaxase-like TrwC/TraI family protein